MSEERNLDREAYVAGVIGEAQEGYEIWYSLGIAAECIERASKAAKVSSDAREDLKALQKIVLCLKRKYAYVENYMTLRRALCCQWNMDKRQEGGA